MHVILGMYSVYANFPRVLTNPALFDIFTAFRPIIAIGEIGGLHLSRIHWFWQHLSGRK